MNRVLHGLFLSAVAALLLAGCVVYEPVPVDPQYRFDRSWAAAAGAMSDQGLSIDTQDRGAGIIRGNRNGVLITARVHTLPDGRIEVRFDQTGATKNDPELVHRVSDSYDRRMGR